METGSSDRLLDDRAKQAAVLYDRVPVGVLCLRVPYSIGALKKDPNLENYP